MHNLSVKKEPEKEGLFYGYIVLAASFFILMILCGAQFSFGVFLKPVLTEFGWTRSVTAAAFSLYFVFFGSSGIFMGRVSDRFGPRVVVTVCSFLVSGGYLLLSQITEVWQIYLIYGVLLSIAMSGIFISISSTIVRWFTTKMGLASGITSAGIGAGIVVIPLIASLLISSYSWRISYMFVGLTALIVPILAQFLKRAPGNEQNVIHGTDEVHNRKPHITMQGLSLQQAISSKQFWIIGITFLGCNICVQTIMAHIIAYASDTGISANVAATILSVIGIVSIVSKVGMGHVFDRIRGKRILITVGTLLFISFIILQLCNELWCLYIFAIVFAMGYGGFAMALAPIIAEYFGLRALGTIFGIACLAGGIGSAIGPYITGLIFDMTGSYNLAFAGCTAICLAMMILPTLLNPIDWHNRDE
jgi:MFS transporter, OFA family, oxalate/formate antiporter